MSVANNLLSRHWLGVLVAIIVVTAAAIAVERFWESSIRGQLFGWIYPSEEAHEEDLHEETDGHDAHEHDDHGLHEGHEESSALELSEVAWKNIGLRTGIVEPRDYMKTSSMPAIVVERPGQSRVDTHAAGNNACGDVEQTAGCFGQNWGRIESHVRIVGMVSLESDVILHNPNH